MPSMHEQCVGRKGARYTVNLCYADQACFNAAAYPMPAHPGPMQMTPVPNADPYRIRPMFVHHNAMHLLVNAIGLVHLTQQLLLQDVFALLVLLGALVRAIVLPPDHFFALPARYVPHYVSAGGHVALARLALLDVDDGVEEVGFAVLAAEVLSSEAVLLLA